MKKLIELLERDARMPHDEMARLLDVPAGQVARDIARLEAEGVILGYKAAINREKYDNGAVTAVIEVNVTPERDGGFDRIATRIARFDEVRSCYLMSGGYDLLITVEAGDLRAVAAFVAEKLSTVGSVRATATHFRLKTYKENGTFHHVEIAPERLPVSP